MATLEVHDGRGLVEYVTISRESTALIGSDPKCDVVAADPRALPIHARLRWRRGTLHVEATPGAPALVVNGRKMTRAKLRQGDEMRFGAVRIFLLQLGEASPDTEKTRVQGPPAACAQLESPAWLDDLEVAPPSVEESMAETAPAVGAGAARPSRSRSRPSSFEDIDAPLLRGLEAAGPATISRDRPRTTWLRRASRVLAGVEQAPGQERVFTSPMVLGLAGTLIVLALLSVGLWRIIVRQAADGAYRRAIDAMVEGDYRDAIAAFDRFLELAPEDPRASEARVRRELAGVRRFLSGGGAAWTEALKAAQAMRRDVGDEPAFNEARAELADVVIDIAGGLADRTRRTAARADLDRIEEALSLHDDLAGKAAEALRDRARVPGKIAAARAAVRKAEERRDALAAMDRAIDAGSAAGIYRAYDALVSAYPDLVDDRDVVERMTRGNELLRQAVTFDPATRPAATEPRPEPLGPLTSLVIRSGAGVGASAADRDRSGAVVFAVAEGIAYGLAADDGAPLWQRPVGLNAPFPPLTVAGREASALVVDARHDELLRIDAATGRLLWRQALGEPVEGPPLVLGNQIFQATPTGKLLRIDLGSGELRGTLDLGTPLGPAPVADELGQFLYLPADRSVLYVVSRDPPGCVAVEYLGHDPGAIPCPPVRVGPYLVLAENHRLDRGRWRVFLLEQEGRALRPLQRIDRPGWTWAPPATRGSVIWALGDRGGLTAWAIGGGPEASPLKAIAEIPPDAREIGPAFARARTEREVWMSAGRIARYDLDPERGKLEPVWAVVDVGPAMAPVQAAGRLAIFTHQAAEGPGTELVGVDPAEGAVAWRTILGRSWPVDPVAAADDDGLATLGIDGRPLAIPRSTLEAGGFVEQVLPEPGAFRMPPMPASRLVHGELSVVIPSPDAGKVLVVEGDGPPRAVELPAPLAAPPTFWGDGLLVPADDGLVYLIDPRTGASRADPYVPPYERSRPYRWLELVPLDADTVALVDDGGRVRRLAVQDGTRRRLVAAGAAVDLGSPPTAAPAATAEALVLATADGRVRALSAVDLSPLGAWPLSAAPAVGPVRIGEEVFVADAAGNALLLGPDGQRRWSAESPEGPPVGPPVAVGEDLWVILASGDLERWSQLDGRRVERAPLGGLAAGGPLALDGAVVVPPAPGTLGLFRPDFAPPYWTEEFADHADR